MKVKTYEFDMDKGRADGRTRDAGCYFCTIAMEKADDAGRSLRDSCAMDEHALIRGAELTMRRAILENFPPGPEREKRLQWLAEVVASRLGVSEGRPQGPQSPSITFLSALRSGNLSAGGS